MASPRQLLSCGFQWLLLLSFSTSLLLLQDFSQGGGGVLPRRWPSLKTVAIFQGGGGLLCWSSQVAIQSPMVAANSRRRNSSKTV